MYFVCTGTYLFFFSETRFTGFRGVLRDANMPVQDAQQPPADLDIDRDDPCPEDVEFFDRPDAATLDSHGRSNQPLYGWHGGTGMQWLQGLAQIALVPASANCQAKSTNDTQRRVGRTWQATLRRPDNRGDFG